MLETDILSDKDFARLKDFIYTQCGIRITDAKKTMLQTRLHKRLRSLKMASFCRYCDYLFSDQGSEDELVEMINVVTTNKTDFFREPSHFDYLANSVLPRLTSHGDFNRTIMVWSAGCSTGEEPYTLAMVLKEFIKDKRGFDFVVLATDISTKVLETAKTAIYDDRLITAIPEEFKKNYLLKSKNADKKVFRIAPELRRHVAFRRLNFMDENFGFREKMDIIFCRNVIIYFDKATQEKLLAKFCSNLSPSGYLFLGHSETLLGMDLPLQQLAPTVYRRTA
jgi:chemotaxis protein methyltransferase CheR